jgi:hypothetical protein
MKLSTIKAIKAFCEGLHSEPCYREVIAEIENGYDDFEVNNVRFIKNSAILSVMTNEIFSDDYVLGCFNASFIADNSSLNYALVKACQDAEAYQAIGQALNETMIDSEKESFCEEYARLDSYGHHFNHYDSNSEELTVEGILYHVFDNR